MKTRFTHKTFAALGPVMAPLYFLEEARVEMTGGSDACNLFEAAANAEKGGYETCHAE